MENDNDPRWLEIAFGELGQSEIPGGRDNPRVVSYLQMVALPSATLLHDEIPWCSAFANYCMAKAGLRGTGSAAARSWTNWGRPLFSPRRGCVAVFRRDAGWTGHVGFFLDEENGGSIRIIGGNQSDRVSIAKWPRSKLIGFRWPRGVDYV
jgi:uncharacterized protein (TIGR02594 family)